jgi:uncharacterized membrane protein (DUF485 family)
MRWARHPLVVIATFSWVGFVCAISFMEAWLKFQAEGVTLNIGLAIGKLVFNTLNRVEWVFALTILLNLMSDKFSHFSCKNTCFLLPLVILILQTFWFLPAMNARIDLYLQNLPVPSANFHFWYVGMEVVKVFSLVVFGIFNFERN